MYKKSFKFKIILIIFSVIFILLIFLGLKKIYSKYENSVLQFRLVRQKLNSLNSTISSPIEVYQSARGDADIRIIDNFSEFAKINLTKTYRQVTKINKKIKNILLNYFFIEITQSNHNGYR